MESFSTIDLEQRLFSLSNYLKNLNVNRTKNLDRLAEQKINCLAEVKAFRVDLNNFFDRIENEFCNEIAVLESFQRKAIQKVVEELKNLEKDITELKVKLETLKDSDINTKTKASLQKLKNYVSTYESKIETLGKENGIKEIDLYMSVKPEVQTLSCRIKALGEVYVTYAPIEIEIDEKESFVPEEKNRKLDEEQLSPDEGEETENEDEEQTMHIVSTRCYTEPEFKIKQEPNDQEFQLDQTVEETSENIDIQKESAQKVLLSPVMRELRPKPTATSSDSNIMSFCSTSFTTPSIPLKLTTINNVPTLIAATQPEGGLKGPFIQVQQFPKPDKIPLKLSSTTQSLNSNPIPLVFCQQPLVGSQSSVNSGPIILQSLPMNTNKNSLSKRPSVRPLCPLPAKRATSELTLTSICPIDDPSSAKQQNSETVDNNSNTPPIQTVKEETLSFDELMAETQKTLSDDQYRMSNFHKTAQVKNARRFNRISADNLQEMLDMDKESKSTKANTKWGVKMFQRRAKVNTNVDTLKSRTTQVDRIELGPISSSVECNECGKFVSKGSLKKHMIRHQEPEFNCIVCEKKFHFSSDLKRHTIIHSGSSKYVCDTCGLSFVSIFNLIRHEKIRHQKQLEYHCHKCNKDFARKATLLLHHMEHDGEKPHKCEKCSKEFKHKYSLKIHKCKDPSIKDYVCLICNKVFNKQRYLKQHTLVHNEPEHQCYKCGQQFKWKSSIRKHLESCKL